MRRGKINRLRDCSLLLSDKRMRWGGVCRAMPFNFCRNIKEEDNTGREGEKIIKYASCSVAHDLKMCRSA